MSQIQSLATLFQEEESLLMKELLKEPPKVFSDDILAVACCVHRINPMIGMENVKPTDISTEDRVLADAIRKHYQQKLVLQSLRGYPTSDYKKSLADFLQKDFQTAPGVYTYESKILGLAYRLPEFYEYDKKLEQLAGGQYRTLNKNTEMFEGSKELHYLDRLTLNTKLRKLYEFWFHDTNNDLVMLQVMKDNPLHTIFLEKVKQGPITINARFKNKSKDTVTFYSAYDKWEYVP